MRLLAVLPYGVRSGVRAVFACWFAIVMVQPVAIHACPMMGGVLEQREPTRHDHPAGQSAGMAHHHMVAAEMVHHDHGAAHRSGPAHDHKKSQCTCVGDCCGSVAAALPTFGGFASSAVRELVSAPVFSPAEQSFEEPAYLRPPSIPPPSLA